jgi:hypothetical protein
MTPEAFLLIEDDPDAQKMVASWPVVLRFVVETYECPPALARSELYSSAFVLSTWSRLSGVSRVEVERLAPVLVENEIVLANGTVDPDAVVQLRRIVTRKVVGDKTIRDITRRPPPRTQTGGRA